MSLLAIDMGTSSCKAVAFSEEGEVVAQSAVPYAPEAARPGWGEVRPETFWDAFQAVTRDVAAQTTQNPVEALAISSHGETFIPVDVHSRPVGPAILNFDSRAVEESAWLKSTFGREHIFQITGLSVHTMYPLPKILWMRNHQKEAFSSTVRFLALPSFLLTQLGLPGYVDYSLASRFLAFDIRKLAWSTEILSACNLKPDQFPEPVAAGFVAGRLAAAVASALGLQDGTLVAVGGHDQPCAALGCGVVAPGRVSASLGTYECLLAASATPATSDLALAANLNSYCHVMPDRFVTIAYFPAGIMVEWLFHLLCSEQQRSASSVDELCAALEARTSDEPTGLCVAPHLMGTCNPDFDPHARGVIAGILPSTDRYKLYQGTLEGIACEFATMAGLLQNAVGPCDEICITGGGGRSRLGLKLRAGLASRRLRLMKSSEAVCLGTAILAGLAASKYSSFAEAIRRVVVAAETIHPDPTVAKRYRTQVEQYHLLYSSLAPVRQAQAAVRTGGETE